MKSSVNLYDVLHTKWVHFLRVLHAFYIISVRATNYFKKQKSLGISCKAFIGAYDFCTLSITEVMIDVLYRQTNYLNINMDI